MLGSAAAAEGAAAAAASAVSASAAAAEADALCIGAAIQSDLGVTLRANILVE